MSVTRVTRTQSLHVHLVDTPTTQHLGVPVQLHRTSTLENADGTPLGAADTHYLAATAEDITDDLLAQLQDAVAYLGLDVTRRADGAE